MFASLPAWQLICWFTAGPLLAPVPAGVQLGVPGRTAAGGNVRTDPDTMHTTVPTCTPTTPVGTPLMLTPNVAYMVFPSGGNSTSGSAVREPDGGDASQFSAVRWKLLDRQTVAHVGREALGQPVNRGRR
ncbi:MAG: hypothetical protein LC799_32605 [Actinobacteria bacterium]|nr:hypothetical protein [Actinomycetota bacterium]